MNNRQLGRRRFLQHSVLLPAAAILPFRGVLAQSRQIASVGLQLYTLRRELAADFEGTLGKVAELGYQELEFAGYYDRSADEVRNILVAEGMTSPAAHIQLAAVQDNLQAEIDFAAELGQRYIVVPYLPSGQRSTDDYRRHAETLNRAGELTRKAGISMAYHNHDFEFESSDDGLPYDILLRETDPELVAFELDLYWIANAGVDPMPYFESHPGRFSLLHLKDRDAAGGMAAVGKGSIDFAAIFSQVDKAGFQHYFVEHDNPEDALASVASSINTLHNLRF